MAITLSQRPWKNISAAKFSTYSTAIPTGLAISSWNVMIFRDIIVKVRQRYPFSFGEGLQQTRSFHVPGPRDKSYALLGITHHSYALVRVADHGITIEEQHFQRTENYITATKSPSLIVYLCIEQIESKAYTSSHTWFAL